jgi:hypothetical protein
MRPTILIVVAAMADFGFQAAVGAERKTLLTVYVLQENVAPSLVVMPARARAGKMFADIGISIQWRSGPPHASSPRNFVIVEMADYTPRDCYPGALAYAMPYDRLHIKVFYDRVRGTVYSQTVPALLAHVFVHEITHVIQGFSRHSSVGIMKARWDVNDYLLMQSKPLTFTEEDIHFIRQGLAARETAIRVAPRLTGSREYADARCVTLARRCIKSRLASARPFLQQPGDLMRRSHSGRMCHSEIARCSTLNAQHDRFLLWSSHV